MNVNLLCHVDRTQYKDKPSGAEVSSIQTRFKAADFMAYPAEMVIEALERGQTIALAECEDRRKDRFKQANSLALDFDNGHGKKFDKAEPAERAAMIHDIIQNDGTITPDEVNARCRELGFSPPAFIYKSFSYGKYYEECVQLESQGLISADECERIRQTGTFRAVWVFDTVITDKEEYFDIYSRFTAIFSECDPDFKPAGILFGTRYTDTIRSDGALLDITTMPRPEPPPHPEPQSIALDPPAPAPVRTAAPAVSATTQAESQRRNIEVYLRFVKPSMLNDGEWLNVANAMKTEGFSYSEFDDWCRSDGDPRYDEAENLKRWDSLTPGMNDGGTICYYAKTLGHMTDESFKAALYPQGIKPKHTDFVAYNFDGTPEAPAGAAAPAADTDTQSEEIVRLSDLTLEQIKALTTEQWNGIIYQHYKTPAETESVTQKFTRFYERCYRGRLLQDNGLLPLYIQPIIKTRRQNGLIYTTLAGFEINPVPLARSIQEDHHIINIPSRSSTAGLLYIYKNGKYERIDGEEERGVVRDRLELIDHMGKIWNTKTVKDTSLLLHSPSETHELDEFNADETIINFQNGILDLTTGTLYPHSHARLTTVQLPLSYDPSAGTDTPIFDSMIDHFAGGDDEVKTLLLQMCALAISNVDMGNLKCFLMMYGARDSGKSQLFKLLHKLIGEKNTHTTTLHKLENNNFEPMNLYGKRFAGHAELDNNSTVRHVGIVKALTGGDYVSGEVKCGGVYNFRYKGVLMFCSNDKPRLPSADAAFYERLRLVYVAKSVDTKDLHFLDKMWSERQKIINKLLPYLHAVITDGQVLDPASSKVLKKAYKAENNPAIEFFVECCEMRPKEEYDTNARKGITDGQDSKFIYDKFYRWCLDSGYTAHDIPVRNEFAKSVGRYLAAESKSDSEDVKVHKRNGNYYTFKLRPYACTDMNTIAETDTDTSAGAERAAELDMTATEFEQFGDVLI